MIAKERPLATLGVVSDTHDLLREEALEELSGVDLILHAGDVCSPEILEQLGSIAPVVAVRGNCDFGEWAGRLPVESAFQVCGWRIRMIHNVAELSEHPELGWDADMVVFGHTHTPHFALKDDGTLFLNPGSAGRKRFDLPVAMARVELYSDHLWVEAIEWPEL